ncbi:hypothetical protein HDEF_0180 [Candidatus Hamiltonella defensa 5AT (Acyrthosiphon pisum)]|uniref:Uncharacterized protein n=1 Tax=Hamiltonella defensa subsp. Acyrthosiphon pisum (strain 5AT) TaxID=572265 RepID=C4K8W6_HAMD5|nr:hypothetical protein HDEF_0180 [Candidatus Hamiltonella defensa 5AT (Acyrthosiphon pisum)]
MKISKNDITENVFLLLKIFTGIKEIKYIRRKKAKIFIVE